MKHPFRIGLKLAPQATTIQELHDVWDVAERSGFDHVWVFDHFAGIGGDPTRNVYDGWTLLAAMAERTKRVRIGCMVTGNTYRHPSILAKMAVTVDHLSNGRLEFGIGAAWAENEHTMLGLDFPRTGVRIDRLEEACQVIKLLWTEDWPTFEGKHYQLKDALGNPRPLQKPHPPIWIGGSGEKKTLRVTAKHADAWNATGADPEEFGRLCGVLDKHCEDVGRDPSEIRRTAQLRWEGDGEELLRAVGALRAKGLDDLIIYVRGGKARRHSEKAAEMLPRLRTL